MQKNQIIVGLLVTLLALSGVVIYVCGRNATLPAECKKYDVSFDEGMKLTRYPARLKEAANQHVYDIFKQVYEKNHPGTMLSQQSTEPKIPKIIHQIWLGSPFPEKYRAFQASWQQHHPDWEYRLWTDKELAEFPLVHRDLFEASHNYGEKSDIARYEILYRFGGVYVDTDFESYERLDTIHQAYDFYIGIQPLDTSCVQLGIGLIGSAPGHPVLRCCLANLRQNMQQTQQIIARTGPVYFTRVFAAVAPSLPAGTVALPASFVYPMAYEQTGMGQEVWRCPESLAVHHWEGSWLKKEAFVK